MNRNGCVVLRKPRKQQTVLSRVRFGLGLRLRFGLRLRLRLGLGLGLGLGLRLGVGYGASTTQFWKIVENTIISQSYACPSIDNIEISHLNAKERLGGKCHICIFVHRISVVCCGQQNVSPVCQDHTVFLESCNDDLRGGVIGRTIESRLETEAIPIDRRSSGFVGGGTGMRRWVHKSLVPHFRVGKDESDGVIDDASGEFVSSKQQLADGETSGITARALVSSLRSGVNSAQIPLDDAKRIHTTSNHVGLVRFPEDLVDFIDHEQMAIIVGSVASVISLTFDATSNWKGKGGCGLVTVRAVITGVSDDGS